ncbi:hypothetical protein TEA_003886 [Camellia sinensis var. sinensis]|uniref:Uncharacterized protein n=1 Tax=Camellia sinensis var. sinensis TaxID=542762 RepID=A0A4S4EVY7_CAMSN|nr:hypothetical protein TEA_003886 [Camellia sinensis var. sinensis]
MANKEEASSSSCVGVTTTTTTTTSMVLEGDEEEPLYGSESGWVEALTSCDHLASLASDLIHIPTPDSHCNRIPTLMCLHFLPILQLAKGATTPKRIGYVYTARMFFVAVLSTSTCSSIIGKPVIVWHSATDAQVILALRPVYETAYLLKFGKAPPFRTVEFSQVGNIEAEGSTSSK